MDGKNNRDWFINKIIYNGESIFNENGIINKDLFENGMSESIVSKKLKDLNISDTHIIDLLNNLSNDDKDKEKIYIFFKKLDIMARDYKDEHSKLDNLLGNPNLNNIELRNKYQNNLKDLNNIKNLSNLNLYKKDILGNNMFKWISDNPINQIEDSLDYPDKINMKNVITLMKNMKTSDLNKILESDLNTFDKLRYKYLKLTKDVRNEWINEVVKLHSYNTGNIHIYGNNGELYASNDMIFHLYKDILKYGIKNTIVGNTIGVGKSLLNLKRSPLNVIKSIIPIHLVSEINLIKTSNINDNIFKNLNSDFEKWERYFKYTERNRQYDKEEEELIFDLKSSNNFHDSFKKIINYRYSNIITKMNNKNPNLDEMFKKRQDIFKSFIKNDNYYKNISNGESFYMDDCITNTLANEIFLKERRYNIIEKNYNIHIKPITDISNHKYYGFYIVLNKDNTLNEEKTKELYENLINEKDINNIINYARNFKNDSDDISYNNENISFKNRIDNIISHLEYPMYLENEINNINYDLNDIIDNITIDDIQKTINIDKSEYELKFSNKIHNDLYKYFKTKIQNDNNLLSDKKDEINKQIDDYFKRNYSFDDPYIEPLNIHDSNRIPLITNIDTKEHIYINLSSNDIILINEIKGILKNDKTLNKDELNKFIKGKGKFDNIDSVIEYLKYENNSKFYNLDNLINDSLYFNINNKELNLLKNSNIQNIISDLKINNINPSTDMIENILEKPNLFKNKSNVNRHIEKMLFKLELDNILSTHNNDFYKSEIDETSKNIEIDTNKYLSNLDELKEKDIDIISNKNINELYKLNKELKNYDKDSIYNLIKPNLYKQWEVLKYINDSNNYNSNKFNDIKQSVESRNFDKGYEFNIKYNKFNKSKTNLDITNDIKLLFENKLNINNIDKVNLILPSTLNTSDKYINLSLNLHKNDNVENIKLNLDLSKEKNSTIVNKIIFYLKYMNNLNDFDRKELISLILSQNSDTLKNILNKHSNQDKSLFETNENIEKMAKIEKLSKYDKNDIDLNSIILPKISKNLMNLLNLLNINMIDFKHMINNILVKNNKTLNIVNIKNLINELNEEAFRIISPDFKNNINSILENKDLSNITQNEKDKILKEFDNSFMKNAKLFKSKYDIDIIKNNIFNNKSKIKDIINLKNDKFNNIIKNKTIDNIKRPNFLSKLINYLKLNDNIIEGANSKLKNAENDKLEYIKPDIKYRNYEDNIEKYIDNINRKEYNINIEKNIIHNNIINNNNQDFNKFITIKQNEMKQATKNENLKNIKQEEIISNIIKDRQYDEKRIADEINKNNIKLSIKETLEDLRDNDKSKNDEKDSTLEDNIDFTI